MSDFLILQNIELVATWPIHLDFWAVTLSTNVASKWCLNFKKHLPIDEWILKMNGYIYYTVRTQNRFSKKKKKKEKRRIILYELLIMSLLFCIFYHKFWDTPKNSKRKQKFIHRFTHFLFIGSEILTQSNTF